MILLEAVNMSAHTKQKLMKVSYYDTKAEIRLECYSDTVVITSYALAVI